MFVAFIVSPRRRAAIMIGAALGLCAPFTLHAQRAAAYEQAALAARHNGSMRDRFGAASTVLNAVDLARIELYDALREAERPAVRDARFSRYLATDLFVRPPRFAITRGTSGETFRQLVPEAQAMLDWTHAFRRQVLDVLAQAVTEEERRGQISELVGYYRSRPALAVSTHPKDVGAINAQMGATEFRALHERVNGQMWATQWLELALLEALTVGRSQAERADLVRRSTKRFREMLDASPSGAPFLMPVSTAVAPTLAARYPDVAAILDNIHLLQDYIADLMVAREIPRSAHRREIVSALKLFRNDTTAALPLMAWSASAVTPGVQNMGGPGVGFPETAAAPTVARGMTLAPTLPAGGTAMDHASMNMGQDTSALRAIIDRMLADPVIRERSATDPVLQRLLQQAPSSGNAGGMSGMSGMPGMPGMQPGAMPMTGNAGSASMPGMSMNPAGPGASDAETRLKNDFVLRLLADPAIEARIHANPELHRLWSDPEVQKRLQELRAEKARTPAPRTAPRTTPPPPPPAAPHRH